MELKFIENKNLKTKPDFNKLGFGKYFTDYMFTMKYANGEWQDAKIEPYAPVPMDLSTMVLHYAQGIFDGLKAYRDKSGKITLFRPEKNFARLNRSAARLCIPQFDEEFVLDALKKLILLEKDWIPDEVGKALYIRPTVVATDAALGVHASSTYLFYIILSPVGSYYEHGLAPTKIYVEDFYVRSMIGGTGEAKCIANYAISLKAGEEAHKKGFDQVLWLDGKNREYAEEVGSMNIFFIIDDEVVTPMLTGSILPGITRMSSVEWLKANGYKASERLISIKEIIKAHEEGRLKEVFGTGTAAVISPVGLIEYKGKDYVINGGKMGKITETLYDNITGIQTGRLPDKYGWITKLN